MSPYRTLHRALAIGILAALVSPEAAHAFQKTSCATPVSPSARLLKDVPNSIRNLLPLPLYGVPKLFMPEPKFTKNGSQLYTELAVWKGSNEELIANGIERKTGQRGTFVVERGAALRGLQYVPATLPVHGCWDFHLKTKSASISFKLKV